jgi:hypothetical protein
MRPLQFTILLALIWQNGMLPDADLFDVKTDSHA